MLRHWAAVLAYVGLTVALTWPLVLHPASVVPNDLGDPLLSTWTLWWNATVWPLTERWWDGTMFFPARDTLTLSDHRLGIGFITTPIIWFGGSPVLAYNIGFLASYALSAIAAYGLCYVVTGHFGAALLGGLVFGFNPFRAGHLPHLELLCSYWLPVALLALHRWHDTQRPAWLVVLSAALTMQALTSVYYFAFFSVVIGLWLLWFARDLSLRRLAALAVSVAVPLAAIAPILVRYKQAHASMGLARTLQDVEHFSADLRSLITTPQALFLWKTPMTWDHAEGALYPGAVAVAIVIAGLVFGEPGGAALRARARWLRHAMLFVAVAFLLVVTTVLIGGPIDTTVAGLRISATEPFKPLTVALVLLTVWLLTTRWVRHGWAHRSALMFYALATVAMWVFALGPTGRVMGEPFLYKAPYSWLMLIPGVDTAFRVPARFGMLAALTLCVAVALAWARMTGPRSTAFSLGATILVAGAIAADSWMDRLALPTLPTPLSTDGLPPDAVVVELPLGTFEDAAAMYRSILHGRPTVNGLSGYAPPHYQVLHSALSEGRVDALGALADRAPLAVFVNREKAGDQLVSRLHAMASAAVTSDATHDVVLIARSGASPVIPPDMTTTIRMRTGRATVEGTKLPLLADGQRTTGWLSTTQQGTEVIVADLGEAHDLRGLALSLGAWPGGFPRQLHVRTSPDGTEWREAWQGDVAAIAVRAAIANQRDVTLTLPFDARGVRYIELRQVGFSAIPWALAEFGAIPQ